MTSESGGCRPRSAPWVVALVLAAFVVLPAAPASAQITIRMATMMPANSAWARILKEMAAEWNRASGGKVELRLFLGATRGDDQNVVRDMRTGALVGGALAGFRLSSTHLFVQHATLWLAFVGAVAATRQGAHLTLSTTELLREGRARTISRLFGFSIAAAVSAVLAYASYTFVVLNRSDSVLPALGVPQWTSELVMPVALGIMALIFAWKASDRWPGRVIAALAIPAACALGLVPRESASALWPLGLLVAGGALFGAPVFVAMGGIALVGFVCEGVTVASVSSQVHRLIASEELPAIPLLTAAGYVLAESAAFWRTWSWDSCSRRSG
jgi:hypothetical protein